MIRTLDQVLAEAEITRLELTAWIEQRWVRPAQEDGAYVFDEADTARVRLICELRRDLSVDDETIPVVLSLLDQVYALRRGLGLLVAAINEAPEAARREILDRIERQR